MSRTVHIEGTMSDDTGGIVEEALPMLRWVNRNGEKVLQHCFKQTDTWHPHKGHRTTQRLVWRDVPTEVE